jgi:hypothetical protein
VKQVGKNVYHNTQEVFSQPPEVRVMFKKSGSRSSTPIASNPYYNERAKANVYVPPPALYKPAAPGSRGGGCFVAGTRVTMADGTHKPIDKVRVGERVLAFDESTGRVVPAAVTQVYVHPDWKDRAAVVLVNGRLQATANHLFFVNGTWRRADELQVGDLLRQLTPLGIDAGPARNTLSEAVASLAPLPGADIVYNLEVATYHTYFAEGLLVHNMKSSDY